MMIWPLDDVDYTAEAIGAFAGARSRGVFAAEDCFRVSAAGGFRIRLTSGLAWLKKDKYWGTALLETADSTLTVDVGSGDLPRYVAVALLLDKTANEPRVELRYGDYAASPRKPQPRRDAYYDEIIVATILQRAGAVEITGGDITDERTNAAMCGLMRDAVERIPLDGLTEQMRTEFDVWFAKMKDQLSEDAAGRLQQEIDSIEPNVIQPYEARLVGQTIQLTGTGDNIRFLAPTTYTSGMSFSVNGHAAEARTIAGDALWAGFFASGSVVVAYKNGDILTFSAGGLTAADKDTVRSWMVSGHSVQGGAVQGGYPAHSLNSGDQSTVRQNMKMGTSILGGSVAGTLEYKVFGSAYACSMGENFHPDGTNNIGGYNYICLGMDYRNDPYAGNDAKSKTGTFVIRESGNYDVTLMGVLSRYENGQAYSGVKVKSGGKVSSHFNQAYGGTPEQKDFPVSFTKKGTLQLKAGDEIWAYADGRNNVYNFGSVNLLIIKK